MHKSKKSKLVFLALGPLLGLTATAISCDNSKSNATNTNNQRQNEEINLPINNHSTSDKIWEYYK
ncbi:hypothetical protein [Metamycoplasma alkalescens]|uniref:hypothetical protein n=1 Tax=Metamycoplasma alkalescens TaxID=45363 RepID=UPI0003A89C96|nr:hypothetical protein [Metamycoplasma alkalescens]